MNQIIGKILPSKRLKILKRQLIKPSPHGYNGVKGDNLPPTICQTEKRLVYIEIIRHWISDRQFLKLMKSINSRGETPLHIAALSLDCFKPVLRMVMELDISPSKVSRQLLQCLNSDGESVLHIATRLHPANLRLMFDLLPTDIFCSILANTNSFSQTALHLAILHSNVETVSHLDYIFQEI